MKDESNKRRIEGYLIIALVLLGICAIGSLCVGASTLIPTEDLSKSPQVKGKQDRQPKPKVLTPTYKVVEIVDGDTLKIDLNGEVETVRLLGIDTPESKDPNRPVECYAKEAAEKLKTLTLNKEVEIGYDSLQGRRDRYGRLLLYISLPQSSNHNTETINAQLVAGGYAKVYTKIESDQMDYYLSLQQAAQESKLGLWGDECACNKNQETTRKCISCNTAQVTYSNWDCSTYTKKERDPKCSTLCQITKPSPNH